MPSSYYGSAVAKMICCQYYLFSNMILMEKSLELGIPSFGNAQKDPVTGQARHHHSGEKQ